jgi:hypothetical protein
MSERSSKKAGPSREPGREEELYTTGAWDSLGRGAALPNSHLVRRNFPEEDKRGPHAGRGRRIWLADKRATPWTALACQWPLPQISARSPFLLVWIFGDDDQSTAALTTKHLW